MISLRDLSLSSPRLQRRGTFLILVLAVLVAIVLMAGQYFVYMQQQRHLSHRGGRQRLLGNLALGLATLAAQKLNVGQVLLNNPDLRRNYFESASDLRRLFDNLSRPLADMDDNLEGTIDLTEASTCSVDFFLEPLLQLAFDKDQTVPEIRFSCRRDDFQPCGLGNRGYPREKKGLLRLTVRLTASRGAGTALVEEFHFGLRVKVSALLAPILSKFSLYLEDAGQPGEDLFVGYNQVSVNGDGNLATTRSRARPLELDNDGGVSDSGDIKLEVPTTFDSLVKAPRGLVYFGGSSEIILNLARSDQDFPQADSGEGFHSFRKYDNSFVNIGRKPAVGNAGEIIHLEMEQGASDDPRERAASWYRDLESFSGGAKMIQVFRAKYSSLFRLMGVQGRQSPTLVFGPVTSGLLAIRGFAFHPPLPPYRRFTPLLSLNWLEADPARLSYFICYDLPPMKNFLQTFGLAKSEEDARRYRWDYGTCFSRRNYNLALGYIRKPDRMDPYLDFPAGDPLREMVTRNVTDPGPIHQIPEPLKPDVLVPGVTSLSPMEPFIQAMRDTDRVVYTLPGPGDTDFTDGLRKRGLLSAGRWALNGWVRVPATEKLELPTQPIRYVAGGGILVEKGDIHIRNEILPTREAPFREKSILFLVALHGNIIIDVPTDTRIQAVLIAAGPPPAGRIIFRGGRARITGALAMRRIFQDPTELETFVGPKVSYLPELAALPGISAAEGSCQPLLTFQFEPQPWMVH